MSNRESQDNTSASGVSYPGASSAAMTQKGVKYSQHVSDNVLQKRGAFNGHPVQVFADGAVWDTVSNKYLFPGQDYDPNDVQRR